MFPNSPNILFYLIDIVIEKDELGINKQVKKTERKVVGCIKSITSFDFNSSVIKGVSFDLKVIISSLAYKNEKFIFYSNDYYKIERTFYNGSNVELYVSRYDEVSFE